MTRPQEPVFRFNMTGDSVDDLLSLKSGRIVVIQSGLNEGVGGLKIADIGRELDAIVTSRPAAMNVSYGYAPRWPVRGDPPAA